MFILFGIFIREMEEKKESKQGVSREQSDGRVLKRNCCCETRARRDYRAHGFLSARDS